jgi:hypothetical protein
VVLPASSAYGRESSDTTQVGRIHMAFMNALKGAMNPFGNSKLNPMNAPGMGRVAGAVGKLPGMQKLGGMPGMNKMSQVTPGMKGMFQPQKGIGPSAPPMQPQAQWEQAEQVPQMQPPEMPQPPQQLQVQPQQDQRSRFAQQMMPRNKQQFMRGLNPFNLMR